MLEKILKQNFKHISEEYKKFCIEKKNCKECKQFNCYKNVVLSEGNGKNPMFMFVAEAPGSTELEQNRPLIGPAGRELRSVLREFGFNRDNSILTNVMPCRPENNKFPSDLSIVKNCYFNWLKREIYLLKPKFIITCGANATKFTFNKMICKITETRGRWIFNTTYNCWTIATWHPSYVLRCKNDKEKQNVAIEFRNDIKKVKNEWHALYSDKRLHMSEEQKKNNSIKTLLEQHEEMMESVPLDDLFKKVKATGYSTLEEYYKDEEKLNTMSDEEFEW